MMWGDQEQLLNILEKKNKKQQEVNTEQRQNPSLSKRMFG